MSEKRFKLGDMDVCIGGDADNLVRDMYNAMNACKMGQLRIIVTLDGSREEREDVRAAWREHARWLNVGFEESAYRIVLG